MYAVRERRASEYVKGTRAPWRVRATHAMCTIRTRLCTEQVPCATVRSPLLSALRARRCQISCGSFLRLAWGEKEVEGSTEHGGGLGPRRLRERVREGKGG